MQVIVCFFLAVSTIVTYKVISQDSVEPKLKQAQIELQTQRLKAEQAKLKREGALEAERIRVKRASIQRYNDLNFYGAVGILCVCGLALVIVAAGYSRAKIKHASVHIARIGQHSEIPVHHSDLQNFYPIAVNLSLAEIEASVSTAHEQAYHISRQMLDDITMYTRAIAGKRGMLPFGSAETSLTQAELPALTSTPTFAELLQNGMIAPGKPLVIGYDRQGQPQYRSLKDLKSVAIAGWQGSGKTLSTGYLVASSVLAYGVHAYIVDPHKQHDESLYALIQPLERTGWVTVINPFDTPRLLEALNQTLDQRLNGEASSEPGILLVIDEMARLAKMECFDVLIAFLERCTEETRKANITFLGGSHKWTARHFKGRADIRGCMNSMLIHKTKPSQADLLLEDASDKNLVKQLQRPGDAILATDYDTPTLVSMPFCTYQDMETVADMVDTTTAAPLRMSAARKHREPDAPSQNPPAASSGSPAASSGSPAASQSAASKTGTAKKRKQAPGVIVLDQHRKVRQFMGNPQQLTIETIQQQLQIRKQQDTTVTQADIARQAGMSPSYLSKILHGQAPLKDKYKQKLYTALFGNKRLTTTVGKG